MKLSYNIVNTVKKSNILNFFCGVFIISIVSGCTTSETQLQNTQINQENKGGLFGTNPTTAEEKITKKSELDLPTIQFPALPSLNSAGGNLGNNLFSETRTHGYHFSDQKVASIPIGSSQEKVRLSLGTPSTTSSIGGNAFYYIGQVREQTTFLPPKIIDQKVLVVYFDKNNRVNKIANYGLEDGKIINFLDRKTATGGDETTFVKQLFNNLLTSQSL